MGGDAEKEVLKILETAMKRENDAEKLYRRGVEIAVRPEVKEVFNQLADEESKHEKLLRDLYRETKKRLGLKIFGEDDPS